MESLSTLPNKETCFSLFCEKYPDLALFLQLEPPTSSLQPLTPDEEEVVPKKGRLIYLYGLSATCHPKNIEELLKWNKEDPSHFLILIEDDLEAFQSWLEFHFEEAYQLLSTSQVKLVYLNKKRGWRKSLHELIFSFPTQSVQVILSLKYQKEKKAFATLLEEFIYKESFYAASVLKEAIHIPTLLENYLENIKHLTHCYSFDAFKNKGSNIPAIICGAGPSLDSCLSGLKKLKDKAFIFAAGSAITALGSANIDPHFLVAIDPNFNEYLRLKDMKAFEVMLLQGMRLYPGIFNLTCSPISFLKSRGPNWINILESFLQEESRKIIQSMDKESSTVLTLAVAIAVYLGCNPIILVGVDLAHPSKKSYSKHVCLRYENSLEEEELVQSKILKKKGSFSKEVDVPLKWWAESKALEKFIKKFPDINFINTSLGIFIANAKTMDFKTCKERYLQGESYDLLALCQALKQEPIKWKKRSFLRQMNTWEKSATLVLNFLETGLEILLDEDKEESEKKIELLFLEEDVKKESFYRDFLHPLRESLALTLEYRPLLLEDSKAWNKEITAALIQTTQELHKVIKSYLLTPLPEVYCEAFER